MLRYNMGWDTVLRRQSSDTNFHISINSLRPRQSRRHFADDIFKCIFSNEYVWIPIKISLKFVPKGPINNIPELVQIMAWRRPGDKPLSETKMISLPAHICVTRPQWVSTMHWIMLIRLMCFNHFILNFFSCNLFLLLFARFIIHRSWKHQGLNRCSLPKYRWIDIWMIRIHN